jgi:hypothetical protein
LLADVGSERLVGEQMAHLMAQATPQPINADERA